MLRFQIEIAIQLNVTPFHLCLYKTTYTNSCRNPGDRIDAATLNEPYGGQIKNPTYFFAEVAKSVDIPIVANGGGGDIAHFSQAFESGASAVCCGTKFTYQAPHKAVLISYLSEEEYLCINPEL